MSALTGISDEVLFNVKKTSLEASTYRASIQPNNQSTGITAGSTSTFYIPSRPKTYLDTSQSCLQFTVNNTVADTVLDTSAFSFIDKLEIFCGSQLLESISNYGLLCNILLDYQYNLGQRVGLSMEWGCTSSHSSTTEALGKDIHLAGETLAVETRTYSLPITSGIIGSLLEKFLPLGLNDSIRVEITWTALCNNAGVIVAGTDLAWTIQNPLLQLVMIELGSEAESIVRRTAGDTPVIYGSSYRSYTAPISANTSNVNVLIPARFGSLNAILACARRYTTSTNVAFNMSRFKPFKKWYLTVGSENYPQRPIDSSAEEMTEIRKCFGILNTTEQAGSVFKENYNAVLYGVNAGATSWKNKHAMGVSLETFAHRTSTINSGLATLSTSLFLNGECDTVTGDATLHTFAVYDMLLVVENGLLSVRF